MKVKVINKSGFELPKYETKNSAGLDLRVSEEIYKNTEYILAGERKLLKTGLFLEIPEGYEAQIRPRSGWALKHGITVLNSPGTIDADYRGEIGVILINHSNAPFRISYGDRIAQMVFDKVEQAIFEDVNDLSDTDRGQGGFGSTGKN